MKTLSTRYTVASFSKQSENNARSADGEQTMIDDYGNDIPTHYDYLLWLFAYFPCDCGYNAMGKLCEYYDCFTA